MPAYDDWACVSCAMTSIVTPIPGSWRLMVLNMMLLCYPRKTRAGFKRKRVEQGANCMWPLLMKTFRQLLMGVLVALFLLNPSYAELPANIETLVWNRAPLRIALPVNQERRVDFPVEVVAYIPDAIADKLTLTATLEGSLFWRATAAFKTERMIVTDKSGRVQWLLDVSADPQAPRHTLVIRDSRVQLEASNALSHIGHDQTDSHTMTLGAE